MAENLTPTQIALKANGIASGVIAKRYSQRIPLLSDNPVCLPVSMPLSDAANTAGIEYMEVVGLDSDGKVVSAVYDADTTTGGDTNIKPIGIAAQDVVAGSSDENLVVWRSGHFNLYALKWGPSWPDFDEKNLIKKAAFEGAPSPTQIILGHGNKFEMVDSA